MGGAPPPRPSWVEEVVVPDTLPCSWRAPAPQTVQVGRPPPPNPPRCPVGLASPRHDEILYITGRVGGGNRRPTKYIIVLPFEAFLELVSELDVGAIGIARRSPSISRSFRAKRMRPLTNVCSSACWHNCQAGVVGSHRSIASILWLRAGPIMAYCSKLMQASLA